jgi:hypothetical protein
MQNYVFLAVNASLRWLNKVSGVYLIQVSLVSGVYLIQVSLVLIGQQDLVDFSGIGPSFPLAGGLCKHY